MPMAMTTHSTTYALQQYLQHYGNIRAEVWLQIQNLLQTKHLKVNQCFIRKEGTLAYVAEGLLMEHNTLHRSSPVIINFIGHKNCLITRRNNKNHYLKACLPTLIFYWDEAQLQHLHTEFKELKPIYDELCASYDAAIDLRQLVLETASTAQRITLFRENFRHLTGYLKKKDIANYLQLNYTHYLHVNSNLP